MSDLSTTRMLRRLEVMTSAPMFLSGFSQSPPENFHNSEKVEIDVLRDEEDVAIVVQSIKAGARVNEDTLFVNKAFTPPVFKEKMPVNAVDQINRQPGASPFDDPNFLAGATRQAFNGLSKIGRKIQRAIELQWSQVLQTGEITLTDENGVALYTLDYKSKESHLANVADAAYSTTWAADGSTGDPLADIDVLGRIVRRDGKRNPTRLIFGSSASQRFLANADVKARFDNRSFNIGQVAPETRGQGATFQGFVWIGNYRYEMWTYDGFYKDPVTGEPTDYVSANNVIMMSGGARLDTSFGSIPMIVQPESRAMAFLPQRAQLGDQGIDMTINAWLDPNGETLWVQGGTRPLAIPTEIDTFACLTVA